MSAPAAAWLVAAVAAVAVAPPASGQLEPAIAPSRPLVLASSEGPFTAFGDPAASRSGWVVFHATRDDLRSGIYASAGGAPVPVAEMGGTLPDGERVLHLERFGSQPTVNDSFQCAFIAWFSEGGSAVMQSDGPGGRLQIVADSREAFREFGDLAAINRGNQVVFRASVDPANHPDRYAYDPRKLGDPSQRDHPERIPAPTRFTFDGRKSEFHAGLFLDRTSDLVIVGSTEKGLLDLADGFAFNDAGAVAFRASRREKQWSLLVGTGGAATAVADTGARFSSFGVPSIDSRGRIAFLAQGTRGDPSVCRTLIGGGLPEVVADTEDGFVAFGPAVAIDDGGRVAFVARRRDGREALWVATSKGHARELFGAGDLVGRRVVTHLRLGARAFARPDRIALIAQLAPDLEAVLLLQLPR